MSHFPVIVLTKDTADPVAEAERLLAPYDEHGQWFADGSRWDWWVIGGRWTGALDGYDPRSDPANIVTCDLCHGAGTRPDGRERFGAEWVASTGGCNGCGGTGTQLAWSFQPHAGDVLPVAMMSEFLPHAIVTPDGQWHEGERMGWFGMTDPSEGAGEDAWPRLAAELLIAHRDSVAVLVDCHV